MTAGTNRPLRLSMQRMAAYVWASPNTLTGLLLGSIALMLGARAAIVSGAVEFHGGLISKLLSRSRPRFRFSAITLGHVILGMDAEVLDLFRDHEQVHVRQYERWGICFLPAYLLSSLWQLLHGRNAYTANYFERQAYGQTTPHAHCATDRD